MKVVVKPIEMVAVFAKEGKPKPIRFRMEEEEEKVTVTVDQIISSEMEKLAGNPMMVYTCKSFIRGEESMFKLKYELSTMKWIIFKI